MKKITLVFSIVIVAANIFLMSCNKGKNTPPEQDKEFQSSKDVSYANSLVTEMEIIASYAAERWTEQTNPFFQPAPGSVGSISVDINQAASNKLVTVTYNGSVTCRDGKKRNGTITIDFTPSNTTYSAQYYRDPGFVAKVTLNNYSVDGWLLVTTQVFTITNNNAFGYDPKTVDLSWTLKGKVHLQYPADTSKNMFWDGQLVKTFVNTENTKLFATNKLSPINWVTYGIGSTAGTPTAAAQVAYTGTITGFTSRVISYTYVVDNTKPEKALMRDFLCAPDRILATTATTTGLVPTYSEWHPFIAGVASFTSLGEGTAEPREIDYASGEGSPACDNSGTVYIKGITYPIDFKK